MCFAVAGIALATDWAWKGNFAQISYGSNNNFVRATQNICKYNNDAAITAKAILRFTSFFGR